jgi:hypothetical protein
MKRVVAEVAQVTTDEQVLPKPGTGGGQPGQVPFASRGQG